ncbi:unnamed protein product [Brugia timori]|uniref:Uncharacterized protein n=1 Tax=Brugia timori TaxID=42155 RepID=A0A0R3R6T8_9BILA|nr:unnamed protein product [Brugia timori]
MNIMLISKTYCANDNAIPIYGFRRKFSTLITRQMSTNCEASCRRNSDFPRDAALSIFFCEIVSN